MNCIVSNKDEAAALSEIVENNEKYKTLTNDDKVVLSDYTCTCIDPGDMNDPTFRFLKHKSGVLCILKNYLEYVKSRKRLMSKDEEQRLKTCIAIVEAQQKAVPFTHIELGYDEALQCGTTNSRIVLPVVRLINSRQYTNQCVQALCAEEFVRFVNNHNYEYFLCKNKLLSQIAIGKLYINKITAF